MEEIDNLYNHNLRGDKEYLTSDIVDERVKAKGQQEREGYNLLDYIKDDVEQNFNEFFRFTMDATERVSEIVQGDLTNTANIIQKVFMPTQEALDRKKIDKYKIPDRVKRRNERQIKPEQIVYQPVENVQIPFVKTILEKTGSLEQLEKVAKDYKDWKKNVEDDLVFKYKESQERQTLYSEDKGKVANLALLGVSIINNTVLDPNNIFFGGAGTKALVRVPLAEAVYNFSDVYDKNIASYENSDYMALGTIYGLGKAIGFGARALSSGFRYVRGFKHFDNEKLKMLDYDERTSPKSFYEDVANPVYKSEIKGMLEYIPETEKEIMKTKKPSPYNPTYTKESSENFKKYITENPKLETFDPLQKIKQVYDLGNKELRENKIYEEGILESDSNHRVELFYRESNMIPLNYVDASRFAEESLDMAYSLLYKKAEESGIMKHNEVADWETFKNFVEITNKAYDFKHPAISRVQELIATGQIDEVSYNENWNIETPIDAMGKVLNDEILKKEYNNYLEQNTKGPTRESNFNYFKNWVENIEVNGKKPKEVLEMIKSGKLNEANFDKYYEKLEKGKTGVIISTDSKSLKNILELKENLQPDSHIKNILENIEYSELVSVNRALEMRGHNIEENPYGVGKKISNIIFDDFFKNKRRNEIITPIVNEKFNYLINDKSNTVRVGSLVKIPFEKLMNDSDYNKFVRHDLAEYTSKFAERVPEKLKMELKKNIISFIENNKEFFKDEENYLRLIKEVENGSISDDAIDYMREIQKEKFMEEFLESDFKDELILKTRELEEKQYFGIEDLKEIENMKKAIVNYLEDYEAREPNNFKLGDLLKNSFKESMELITLEDDSLYVSSEIENKKVENVISSFNFEQDEKYIMDGIIANNFEAEHYNSKSIEEQIKKILENESEVLYRTNLHEFEAPEFTGILKLGNEKYTYYNRAWLYAGKQEEFTTVKELLKSVEEQDLKAKVPYFNIEVGKLYDTLDKNIKIDKNSLLSEMLKALDDKRITINTIEKVFGKDSEAYYKAKLNIEADNYSYSTKEAIKFYQGSGEFRDFNSKIIRNEIKKMTEKQLVMLDNFKKGFSELKPTEKEITVFRGQRIDSDSAKTFFGDIFNNIKIGDIVENKTFTSVSMTPYIPFHFARINRSDKVTSQMLTIKIPKGSKIMAFGSNANFTDENESFLDKNSKLLITGVKKADNLTIFEAVLLDGEQRGVYESAIEKGFYLVDGKGEFKVRRTIGSLEKMFGVKLSFLKLSKEFEPHLEYINNLYNEAMAKGGELDYREPYYDEYLKNFNKIKDILISDYTEKTKNVKYSSGNHKGYIESFFKLEDKELQKIFETRPIIKESSPSGKEKFDKALTYLKSDLSVKSLFDFVESKGVNLYSSVLEIKDGEKTSIAGFYDPLVNSIMLNTDSIGEGLHEVFPKFGFEAPIKSQYLGTNTYTSVLIHELGHALERNLYDNVSTEVRPFFEHDDGKKIIDKFGYYSFEHFVGSREFSSLFSDYPKRFQNRTEKQREAFAEMFEKSFNPMTIIYEDESKNLLNEFRELILKRVNNFNDDSNYSSDLVEDGIKSEEFMPMRTMKENEKLPKNIFNEIKDVVKLEDGDFSKDWLKEIFIENGSDDIGFDEAIFITNIDNEVYKYSGDFYYGRRGLDHANFLRQFKDDKDYENLFRNYPIAIITPETKFVTINKSQLPYLHETLLKNFPTSKGWRYEEIFTTGNRRGSIDYEPHDVMVQYEQSKGVDYYQVQETELLYKRVDNGEETGDIRNTFNSVIKNLNKIFKLEQASKLKDEKIIKDEEGNIHVVRATFDNYNTQMLNTVKEDTVISALAPIKNELMKNSKQAIVAVKGMLWNDLKHKTIFSDIAEIEKEYNNNELIFSIQNSTELKPLTIGSKLNKDFSKNLRKLYEENIKFRSKDTQTTIADEVMGIDSFYKKNVIQALVRSKDKEFNQILSATLKPEFATLLNNKDMLELDFVKEALRYDYPTIYDDVKDKKDFNDILYTLLVRTNREGNGAVMQHSYIADVYFKSKEDYKSIYAGNEKLMKDWLPRMVDGAVNNMANTHLISDLKKVTVEKWTDFRNNPYKIPTFQSKNATIEGLINEELAYIKSTVSSFISKNVKAKGFLTEEKEKVAEELRFKSDVGVQKYLNNLNNYMIRSGMNGLYSPFMQNILGYKYLTSLNALNEGSINRKAVYSGLEQYGLITQGEYLLKGITSGVEYYSMFKGLFDLATHINNIKNYDVDNVPDLKTRLLLKTWLVNEIENDMDLDGSTKLFRATAFLSKGATLQSYSDVHRKTIAYWELYNIFAKGIPTVRDSPRLVGVLNNLGIDYKGEYYSEMKNYLTKMDKDRLYSILFDGGMTKNTMEDDITNLFQTIVADSGEQWDAFSRETQQLGKIGTQAITKYMLMFKRYAMTQLSRLLRTLNTTMREDGTIADDQLFKKPTQHDILRGATRIGANIGYFLSTGVGSLGLSLVTAYLVGDEQRKARAKAMLNSIWDNFYNANIEGLLTTGADLYLNNLIGNYGMSSSISGSIPLSDLVSKPHKRVQWAKKNGVPFNEMMYGLALTTVMPETVSRAYDTVTLDKDFAPSLGFTSDKQANRYYKRYLREAKRIQRTEVTPQGLIPKTIEGVLVSPFLLLRVPNAIKEFLQEDKTKSTKITGIYSNDVPKEIKDNLAYDIVQTTLASKRQEAILTLSNEELEKTDFSYSKEYSLLSPRLKEKFDIYLNYKNFPNKEAHIVLVNLNDLQTDEEKIKFLKDTMPDDDKDIL